MQDGFYKLVDKLTGLLKGKEVLLASFSGETSDFVRLNNSRLRQAGHVHQRRLELELVDGKRHMSGGCTLAGQADDDMARAAAVLAELRSALAGVPEDPYLLYSTNVESTQNVRDSRLPDSGQIVDAVLAAGAGVDMVGILAVGGIYCGFANSLGQRNWFATHSFHLDWCFYHQRDKAVKSSFAGFEWDSVAFERKVADARRQLGILAMPAKTIDPGQYRVYLSPHAVSEVLGMMCWGGFSLKAVRTKTSPLLKMIEEGKTLSPAVTLRENTAGGLAPNFFDGGFIRPPCVTMVEKGRFKDALAGPRTAMEYGVTPNGSESPQSMDMAGGDLPADGVLDLLETGLYINRLWYLNYSDRPGCRLTGMTRFAAFWVEKGRITVPVNVMRFDETVYNMFGDNLLALTRDCELIPDERSYGGRSTDSVRVPGAVVDRFTFTL